MFPQSYHNSRARRKHQERHASEAPILFGLMQEPLKERNDIEHFEPHHSEFFQGLVRAIRRRFKSDRSP